MSYFSRATLDKCQRLLSCASHQNLQEVCYLTMHCYVNRDLYYSLEELCLIDVSGITAKEWCKITKKLTLLEQYV